MSTLTKTIAKLSLAAVPLAGLLASASPAAAQPRQGSTPASCPVEDENGKVTYVPEGTRIGLFYCGRDGDWHVGWLVDALTASPTTTVKATAVAGAPVRAAR